MPTLSLLAGIHNLKILNVISFDTAPSARRMGYKNLNEPDLSLSCKAQICNEFAIAFLNSDFDHNVHAKGHWDDYSPCDEHFDTRQGLRNQSL